MITPGVWTVSEFDDKPCVKYPVDDSNGWQYWVPQNAHYANGSTEDDARLIAQAPNLLFSCRWLRDMLNAARETLNDAGVAHDLDGDFDAALEDANTAIAKAGWIEREQENQG